MKTANIISKAILVLLTIIAGTTITSAQATPPTPPSITHTTSKSSSKVNINMNGNKLNLKMNDDVFDLKMVFDFDATDVIAAITDELGNPMKAGSFRAWEGNGYDIKIKNDNLDISINRNTVSSATLRHIENVCKELFEDLDLDIDINR